MAQGGTVHRELGEEGGLDVRGGVCLRQPRQSLGLCHSRA